MIINYKAKVKDNINKRLETLNYRVNLKKALNGKQY